MTPEGYQRIFDSEKTTTWHVDSTARYAAYIEKRNGTYSFNKGYILFDDWLDEGDELVIMDSYCLRQSRAFKEIYGDDYESEKQTWLDFQVKEGQIAKVKDKDGTDWYCYITEVNEDDI